MVPCPALPGSPRRRNPSFDDKTRQIVDFIRDERIEKPVLIGHSMGGGLAMNIAANHAELVKGIVVVDALPCSAALYDPDFRGRGKSRTRNLRRQKPGCSA
ncbi:MAG: alpha/beta hydrolase [Alistipes sp.]